MSSGFALSPFGFVTSVKRTWTRYFSGSESTTRTSGSLRRSPKKSTSSSGGGAASGQLMLRPIDQLNAVPLRGSDNAGFPFVSPDGRWVGFFAGGFNGELKKVAITGGPPITLCRFQGAARGASWGADDTIVFATSDLATGLMSVPAAGGEPKVLTKPDAAHGEQDHVFPAWLPDRRSVLYTALIGPTIDTAQVAVLDLESGQRTTLIRGGSDAQYVHTGHLVYASAGTLRASTDSISTDGRCLAYERPPPFAGTGIRKCPVLDRRGARPTFNHALQILRALDSSSAPALPQMPRRGSARRTSEWPRPRSHVYREPARVVSRPASSVRAGDSGAG